MRDFFIRGFEIILTIVLVIGMIAVVGAAIAVVAGVQIDGVGGTAPLGTGARIGAGVGILLGGLAYLLVVGGVLYLGLGIYHNTRRTAELLENRGGRL